MDFFSNDTYAKPTTKKVATKQKIMAVFIVRNFNLNFELVNDENYREICAFIRYFGENK